MALDMSFILPANGQATPASIARQRQLAAALLQSGSDASPVGSPWQAAARVAQGLFGGLAERRANTQEQEGISGANAALAAALVGGHAPTDLAAAAGNPFMTDTGQTLLADQFRTDNPGAAGGLGGYGIQPIWAVGPDGRYHLFQANRQGGQPQEMQFPDGMSPSPGVSYQNTGTNIVGLPTKAGGAPVSTTPIDVAGQQRQQEIGTQQGKQTVAAPGDIQAADNALVTLDSIENDPNLDIGTGLSSLTAVVPGTPAYDFKNKVTQAQKGAFLTAIQQMRGLGSLSNAEGDAATQAITAMDAATSKERFLDALHTYRRIVMQGRIRAQNRLQNPTAIDTRGPQPVPTPDVSGAEQWIIDENGNPVRQK